MQVSKQNMRLWAKFTIKGVYKGQFMALVRESKLDYRTVKAAFDKQDAKPAVIEKITQAAQKLDKKFKSINQAA